MQIIKYGCWKNSENQESPAEMRLLFGREGRICKTFAEQHVVKYLHETRERRYEYNM
jgi:hypothetical protein